MHRWHSREEREDHSLSYRRGSSGPISSILLLTNHPRPPLARPRLLLEQPTSHTLPGLGVAWTCFWTCVEPVHQDPTGSADTPSEMEQSQTQDFRIATPTFELCGLARTNLHASNQTIGKICLLVTVRLRRSSHRACVPGCDVWTGVQHRDVRLILNNKTLLGHSESWRYKTKRTIQPKMITSEIR